MAVGPRARADAEAASMEVVENWELGGGVGHCRPIESEVEIVVFVESTVFPDDGAIVVDRNVEGKGSGPESGAITVDLEDTLEVFYYIGNGPHFKHTLPPGELCV